MPCDTLLVLPVLVSSGERATGVDSPSSPARRAGEYRKGRMAGVRRVDGRVDGESVAWGGCKCNRLSICPHPHEKERTLTTLTLANPNPSAMHVEVCVPPPASVSCGSDPRADVEHRASASPFCRG